MPRFCFFPCTSCGTYIPEDDIGDFRCGKTEKLQCMFCFNAGLLDEKVSEDTVKMALEEFRSLVEELVYFKSAYQEVCCKYALTESQKQNLKELYVKQLQSEDYTCWSVKHFWGELL